ncbi:hypothetical protein ACFY00_37570 [Kitasatospora sp. NPDC001540]
MDHDKKGRLVLFFFYGDPDSGNRNVLMRPADASPAASPAAR